MSLLVGASVVHAVLKPDLVRKNAHATDLCVVSFAAPPKALVM